jgi:hypothetical protein
VQVDPIKPILKGTGTKRLRLNHYKLLLNVAVKLSLRRYIMAWSSGAALMSSYLITGTAAAEAKDG